MRANDGYRRREPKRAAVVPEGGRREPKRAAVVPEGGRREPKRGAVVPKRGGEWEARAWEAGD